MNEKRGSRTTLLNSFIFPAALALNKVPDRYPPFVALLQTVH